MPSCEFHRTFAKQKCKIIQKVVHMHFALNKLMLKLIANECKKKSTTRANAKTRRKVSIDRTNKNFRCECTKSHQPKSR